jgi:hypothetical protein
MIRSIIFVLLVLAFCWLMVSQWDKQIAGENAESMQADTLATITRILQQDKKQCRLLDHWPEAPLVMLEAARKHGIDPYLLPCISRAEGPTPAMLNACNVYGLERRGKLIGFIAHEYATDAAAALLAKHQPAYQSTGLVDIPKLAAIWCPANASLWAGNMAGIYERGMQCR